MAGTTATGRPDGVNLRAHPRVGGDDPSDPDSSSGKTGSSPRWRGRHQRAGRQRHRRGLIPALAGTTSTVTRPPPTTRAHPRVGGDDGGRSWCLLRFGGSSPRWRGRLAVHLLGGDGQGLIPALAGTTRSAPTTSGRSRAHPRVGGDDVTYDDFWSGHVGSSPRWRGRLERPVHRQCWNGLIPALAGTTSPSLARGGASWAHPRVGGDDWSRAWKHSASAGSSPRWRGQPIVQCASQFRAGLIPALAGTTVHPDATLRVLRAHPRVGGDDPFRFRFWFSAEGSSPRWRGRHRLGSCRGSCRGLIPALAGTTTGRCRGDACAGAHLRVGGDDVTVEVPCGVLWAHPRVGGDDQPHRSTITVCRGSSPRWRGRPPA